MNLYSPKSLPGAVLRMALLIVCGSSFAGTADDSIQKTAGTSESATPAAETQSAGTLTAGTWKDVEALVAKNRGKIVVVDIWSLSCAPCVAEFPYLVALQTADPDNIVCVGFNVDYAGIKTKPPETYRPRVEKFLAKHKAGFPNFLCTDEAEKVFGDLKLVSIPAVYVFAPDGTLAKRFDSSLLVDGKEEAFTYDADIIPFVAKLQKQ
jgi:thiol-disulfide isomerase/thioredoxin